MQAHPWRFTYRLRDGGGSNAHMQSYTLEARRAERRVSRHYTLVVRHIPAANHVTSLDLAPRCGAHLCAVVTLQGAEGVEIRTLHGDGG